MKQGNLITSIYTLLLFADFCRVVFDDCLVMLLYCVGLFKYKEGVVVDCIVCSLELTCESLSLPWPLVTHGQKV